MHMHMKQGGARFNLMEKQGTMPMGVTMELRDEHAMLFVMFCRRILCAPYSYVPLERALASWETWLEHSIGMSGSHKEMHGIFV